MEGVSALPCEGDAPDERTKMWGRWMRVFHTAGLCGECLTIRAVPEEVEVLLAPCFVPAWSRRMGGGRGRDDGAGAGGA